MLKYALPLLSIYCSSLTVRVLTATVEKLKKDKKKHNVHLKKPKPQHIESVYRGWLSQFNIHNVLRACIKGLCS